MKKLIIKKLITKNGYYDRKLLVYLLEKGNLSRYIVRKMYRKFLDIFVEEEEDPIFLHQSYLITNEKGGHEKR